MNKKIMSVVIMIITMLAVTMNGVDTETYEFTNKTIYRVTFDSDSGARVTENQVSINIVEAYVTPDTSYEGLINLINSANKSIDIMIYEFWSLSIFQAINRTVREKNISVRILFEDDVYGSYGDSYNRWIMNMFYSLSRDGYNVEVRYDDTPRYVHTKVLIVDNKSVFVSSENFVETAYPPNPYSIEQKPYNKASRGFCVVVWNETIARIFENMFLDEFNSGVEYSYSLYDEPSSQGYVSYSAPFLNIKVIDENAIVETVFSPENSTSTILDLVNNAKHFIMLELAYISNGTTVNELLKALREARQRGVTVQIILEDDYPFDDNYLKIVDNLTDLGFYVVPAFSATTEPLFLHNKGIIIDDELVLVGSINWSDNSLTNNREAALLIRSRNIASFYKEVFAWDWNQSSSEPFDSDGDGLSNAYENDHGLDKFNPDTDGDGLTDYEEVMIYNTDPTDASSPGVIITYPRNNQYIASSTINVTWRAHITINSYYLYLNNSFLGKLDGNSTSYDLSDLSDGTWYNFTLVAELSSGSNVSFSVLFAIDITPPIVSIINPKDGSVLLAGSVTVRWSVIDFSPCSFNIYLNSTLLKSIMKNELTIDLTSGKWIIGVEAIDSAGNSNADQISLRIVQRPSLNIIQPKDGSYTNSSLVLISWNVSDLSLITVFRIYLNSSLIGEISNNTFSYEASLQSDGLYNVTVIAYSDTYGILARDEIEIIRDTVAPKISFIYPENNSELVAGNIIVKWTCSDKSPVNFTLMLDNSVKYFGKALKARINLEPGDHVITLIAIDAAGNRAMASIQVSVRTEKLVDRELVSLVFFTALVMLILISIIIKIKSVS